MAFVIGIPLLFIALIVFDNTGAKPDDRHFAVFESRGIKRSDQVEIIKWRAAGLLAEIDAISIPPENRESGRLVALAKTDLESCVMWAVKALSRQ